jgi:hypothetical protein
MNAALRITSENGSTSALEDIMAATGASAGGKD